MQRAQVAIRPIGNSQRIVIPEPRLAQVGLKGYADMSIERDALVLRRAAKSTRAGWAEAAKQLAAAGDDALVLGELGNHGDADRAY